MALEQWETSTDWSLSSEYWADTTDPLDRFRQRWFQLAAAEKWYIRVEGQGRDHDGIVARILN
jgi:hypothetical protein